ncbi:MAG: type II CAAX prenyl endopeptidase Rce1 family protein [Phototrophicaceae bacterium]
MSEQPTPPSSSEPTFPMDMPNDQGEYDLLIDPLQGLPDLDPDTDPPVRIGRIPVPTEETTSPEPAVNYRSATSDPLFGYAIALAVSFGLTPLLPNGLDLRYTLAWGLLATFGVVAWLLGNGDQIRQEQPEDLIWGGVIGIVTAVPLYLFGGKTLVTTTHLIFSEMSAGTLLAYLVFVMPLGETLFFRGILQKNRSLWIVGGQSTVWTLLLFFPTIHDLTNFWAVSVFIGISLAIVNVVYSWVRGRNGLAASWVCQITVNLILLYLPYVG